MRSCILGQTYDTRRHIMWFGRHIPPTGLILLALFMTAFSSRSEHAFPTLSAKHTGARGETRLEADALPGVAPMRLAMTNVRGSMGYDRTDITDAEIEKTRENSVGWWPYENDDQERDVNQRGRTLFLATTAAKSAYILPEIVDGAFRSLNTRKRLGVSLIGASGVLYSAYAATEGLEMGYGRAALMSYGATLGYVYPLQLSLLLRHATSLDEQALEDGDERLPSERFLGWSSLLALPYGVYAGWRTGADNDYSFGEATTLIYFSQTLGAMGYLLPLYKYDPETDSKRYFTTSTLLTMALIPTGFYIGDQLLQEVPAASGRGALLYVTGAIGTATGYLLPMIADYKHSLDDETMQKLQVATTAAGYTAGSLLGLAMRPDRPVTFPQSLFIGASAASGALAGYGVPYLLDKKNDRIFAAAAVAGGWLGLILGERLSRGIAEQSAFAQNSRLNVSVPGVWSLPAMLAKRNSAEKESRQVPVVNLDFVF